MRGWLVACLGLLVCANGAAQLPPEVERVLSGHRIPRDDVSIVVQAIDAPEPILSHLPNVPRSTASVMKVVTTWAALEALGPAYTWPTEVYYLGPLVGGTLEGDIAFKGYGDPYLVVEELWKLLRALRRSGLEEIDGDLVLDDSHFTVVEPDPGAFDGQPYRTYNVVPNALLMNFKAVQLQFFADSASGKVRVGTDPVLANLDIRNQIRLGDGPCGGFQNGIAFNHADPVSLARVVLDGEFSRRCRPYGFGRTVLQHDTYAFGLFKTTWREVGGKFDGDLRRAVIPPGTPPALVWRSKPLGEVIRSINKNSNNVMTRQLVYTLGAESAGAPGTRENGIAAIRALLEARGLDIASLELRNGAGLARDERASVRLFADLLRSAYRSPYAAEFIASLSLGGLDGTTRGRFGTRSGDAVTHVKTGRLDHVSALVGYVHAGSDGPYVVAIIANTPNAHRGPGQELEEAVVRWIQARATRCDSC